MIILLMFFLVCWPAAGTNEAMYTFISADHALCSDTALTDGMYVGECQDASILNANFVAGNLLVCSCMVSFVLGVSTIKRGLETPPKP